MLPKDVTEDTLKDIVKTYKDPAGGGDGYVRADLLSKAHNEVATQIRSKLAGMSDENMEGVLKILNIDYNRGWGYTNWSKLQ